MHVAVSRATIKRYEVFITNRAIKEIIEFLKYLINSKESKKGEREKQPR